MWRAFASQSTSASYSLMCYITSDETNLSSSCQHKPPLFEGKNNGLMIATLGCTSADPFYPQVSNQLPKHGLPCTLC